MTPVTKGVLKGIGYIVAVGCPPVILTAIVGYIAHANDATGLDTVGMTSLTLVVSGFLWAMIWDICLRDLFKSMIDREKQIDKQKEQWFKELLAATQNYDEEKKP